MPREEIGFTARPKIQSQSQIFRYGRSVFCLPHRPNFSDIFDLCLHWVSVVRGLIGLEITFYSKKISFQNSKSILCLLKCYFWKYIIKNPPKKSLIQVNKLSNLTPSLVTNCKKRECFDQNYKMVLSTKTSLTVGPLCSCCSSIFTVCTALDPALN